MFNWFKKKPVVIEDIDVEEVLEVVPPKSVVVRQPTSSPQVRDYPKSEYSAYWETIHTVENNRHNAKVKFYTFNGKVLSESTLSSATKETLFEKVDSLIKAKMISFKR